MAKKTIEMGQLGATIQARILERMQKFQPDDPRLKETLLRIGISLETQIKLNIQSQRLIDTGRLINSIRHKFYKNGDEVGIEAGSFGIPYAAVHEFGFAGSVSVRPHTRVITQAFGKPIPPKSVQYRGYSRQMNVKARPYLRPAIKKQSGNIVEELRKLIANG